MVSPTRDYGFLVATVDADPLRLPGTDGTLSLGPGDIVLISVLDRDRRSALALVRLTGGSGRPEVEAVSALTPEERRAVLQGAERHASAARTLLQPFETLTRREADILAALVVGHSPKELTQLKGITLPTVRGHIRRMLSKLGVNSQREALAMARRAGWPPQDASTACRG